MSDQDDDERIERMLRERRRLAFEKLSFDATEDHAMLIGRFINALRDRYSEAHDHPILKPIIAHHHDRYEAAKRVTDFSTSSEYATVETIREILALDLPLHKRGRKRPADVVGRAVAIMRSATGEDPATPGQQLGKAGGLARARKLTPKQRSEIARKAAAGRWGKSSRD